MSDQSYLEKEVQMNSLSLAGWVVAVHHYRTDGDKTIFTLRNRQGTFYIEALGILRLCKNDQVLVLGNIYSRFIRGDNHVRCHAEYVSLLRRSKLSKSVPG